ADCERSRRGQGVIAKIAQRADLVGAGTRIGDGETFGEIERLVHVVAIGDIETEKLLLGFGEGAVEDDRAAGALFQRLGFVGIPEADDRAELALFAHVGLDRAQPLHAGGILLGRPARDFLFVVIAENGIEHGSTLSLCPAAVSMAALGGGIWIGFAPQATGSAGRRAIVMVAPMEATMMAAMPATC